MMTLHVVRWPRRSLFASLRIEGANAKKFHFVYEFESVFNKNAVERFPALSPTSYQYGILFKNYDFIRFRSSSLSCVAAAAYFGLRNQNQTEFRKTEKRNGYTRVAEYVSIVNF